MYNLAFDAGVQRNTKYGPRILKTAVPSKQFWDAWKMNKDDMKSEGLQVMRGNDGLWRVLLWVDPEKTSQPEKPIPLPTPYQVKNVSGLLEHQIPHVGNLCAPLWTEKFILDASPTGTGKTFTALAVAREMELRPAIICPKSVLTNWKRVAKMIGVDPIFICNWEGAKSQKFRFGELQERAFIWRLRSEEALLIFDEAHKGKGHWTQNSLMMIAAKKQNIRSIFCTATGASSPLDMLALGYALGLHNLKGFRDWCKQFHCYQNQWNGWECGNKVEAMKKIHSLIFPRKGAKMSDEHLPETQIIAECYDVGIKARDEMEREFTNLLVKIQKLKDAKSAGYQGAVLALQTHYRQLAEYLKVPLLADLTSDAIEDGKSVVIFTNYTETLMKLTAKLRCPGIYGAQPISERQKIIDDFQSDKIRVVVVNIAAGGAGISLHDINGAFPRLALLCPTYNATDLKQALGRVHRAGGKSKSIQRLVYAAGTVEENVAKSVNQKIAAISALNDGDLLEPDIFQLLNRK